MRHPPKQASEIGREADRLAALRRWTYGGGDVAASEPAAWSTLALAAHQRLDESLAPAGWLSAIQQPNGAVGVAADQNAPRWPTALAILAWRAVERLATTGLFEAQIDAASHWLLSDRGKTAKQQPQIGHDTTLVGWSWAADTHSWLEPTCLAVLALNSTGRSGHPRTREGVRLIVDRLLPGGGANYGNTIVLGQELLPHLQPTGLAMLALAEEPHSDPRMEAALRYMEREVQRRTGIASLCFGLMGLTAHDRRPDDADQLIIANAAKASGRADSAYELALMLLARRKNANWLPTGQRQATSSQATAGAAAYHPRVDAAPLQSAETATAASATAY